MGPEQEVAAPPGQDREDNLADNMKGNKQVIDKNCNSEEKSPDMIINEQAVGKDEHSDMKAPDAQEDEKVVEKDINSDEKAPDMDRVEQVVEEDKSDDEKASDLNGDEQVVDKDKNDDEKADLNGNEQIVEKDKTNDEEFCNLNGDEQFVDSDMHSDEKAPDSGNHSDHADSPNQTGEAEMEHDEVYIKQEPMDEDEDSCSFPQEDSEALEQGPCLVMKYDPEFGMTDSVVVVNPEAPETSMQMDMSNGDELDFSASVYFLPPEGTDGGKPPRRTRKSSRKGSQSRRITPDSLARAYVCTDCGQEFKYSHHLVNHVDAIHKQLMKHACMMCGARFAWRNQLQRHIRAMHRTGQSGPNVCVGNVQDFSENVRAVDAVADGGACDEATGEVPGSVFIKQEPVDDYPDVDVHVSFPSGNKKKPMEKPAGDAPSRKRRRKATVKKEEAAPAPKKARPFVCSECGQEFKYSHHLRCHDNAIHKRLTNYACSECEAKFAWRNQLQRHVAAVHKAAVKEEPEEAAAETEEKKEKKKKKEERKKTDRKSIVHVCGECGQEFNWQSHLREHVSAIHKQLKNYVCTKCDAKFSWRNQLMRHMKAHNKEASQADGAEGVKKTKKRRRKRRTNGHRHHLDDDDSDDYHEHVDCKFCYPQSFASNSTKPTGDALPQRN